MSKCKLVVNRLSGNSEKCVNVEDLTALLRETYGQVDVVCIDENNDVKMRDEVDGYDALAVCGGDGTLNSAINAVKKKSTKLIYIPCGTLNDTAKSLRLAKKLACGDRRIRKVDMGKIGDTMFAYVLAAGTFCEIGYTTEIKTKKHFKFFAYLLMVLKSYKVRRIRAKVTLGDRVLEDEYSLVMAINASRCFGFHFNKKFCHNNGIAQILLIKSPKHNGLLGKIEIFFPFFRAFFVGFGKEYDKKNMKFLDFSKASLELEQSTDFTVDGEKLTLDGQNDLRILKRELNLVVW
ncbi:MAG: hypothetical protein IJ735_03630 [Clostridia bacterium]|nr:hypothetical protein [Clostridia bacterium]